MTIKTKDGTVTYEIPEELKGATTGNSGLYMISYTCGVCETRQSRTFTKNAYHKGVVIISCEGCKNMHLIADNLGWFEDGGVNIEQLMERKGEEIKIITPDEATRKLLLEKIDKAKAGSK